MKVRGKMLLAELGLLIASVFVFRSLWLLLDMQAVMHEESTLWFSLFAALAVTIVLFRYVRQSNKK